ncbi:MAG: hypothetical protein H6709_18730 [Kofleriaceae bacterium]|nr:hypothetical protein [Kofleriaceae bacterium]
MPDGSVRVSRGLPLEAVRQVLAGPAPVTVDWAGAAAAATDAATAVVIDAREVAVTPRIGLIVDDGTTRAELPTIWVRKAPKDRDPRLGGHPAHATATALDGGRLVVDALPPGAAVGVLAVVVVGEER